MVSTRRFGRLGNELFQYAAVIGYAAKHGLEWSIPRSTNDAVWNPIHFPDLHNSKWVEGKEDVLVNENWNMQIHYQDIPFIEEWRDKQIVLNGYYQSHKYFDHCRDAVLHAFGLPWEMNKGVCSIHVRRGDYLLYPTKHPVVNMIYLVQAVDAMKKIGIKRFKFFSDDIPWCVTCGINLQFPDCEFEYSTGKSEMEDLVDMSCCQPAGSMVKTINGYVPIEEIKIGDRVDSYSMATSELSGHKLIYNKKIKGSHPGRKVTDKKNRLFNGLLTVIKSENKSSRYTPDHECVVLFGDAFKNKYILYLMKKGDCFRVGITSPSKYKRQRKNDTAVGFSDIRTRASTEKAECVWILDCFDTQEEALLNESIVSYRFGIPQIRYVGHSLKEKDKKRCTDFWKLFGTNYECGKKCLDYYCKDILFPFYTGGDKTPINQTRVTKIRACNLFSGMRVLDYDKYLKIGGSGFDLKSWVEIKVSREYYSGYVYSMTVETNNMYFADGFLTHNCEHQIISNSTMSWWAAELNRNPRKVCIIPSEQNWFGPDNHFSVKDLYREEFVQIKY